MQVFRNQSPLHGLKWVYLKRAGIAIKYQRNMCSIAVDQSSTKVLNIPQGGKIILDFTKVKRSNVRLNSAWQDVIVINSFHRIESAISLNIDDETDTCSITSTSEMIDIDITVPEIIDTYVTTSNYLNLTLKNKVFRKFSIF